MEKAKCELSVKLRRKVKIVDELLAAIFLFLVILTLLNYTYITTNLQHQVLAWGLPGLTLITFLIELIPNFFNPLFPLFLGVSLGLNLVLAITLVCFGSILGSVIGFELGKRYGYRLVCPLFEEKVIYKVISFLRQLLSIYQIVRFPDNLQWV